MQSSCSRMWSRVFEAIEDVGVAESPSLNVSSRRPQLDVGDTARSRHHKPRHFPMFVRYKQLFYCDSHCGTTLTSKDVHSVGGVAQTSFHGLRGRLNFARCRLIIVDAPSTPLPFKLCLRWLQDLWTKICVNLCMNKTIFPYAFVLEHTHTTHTHTHSTHTPHTHTNIHTHTQIYTHHTQQTHTHTHTPHIIHTHTHTHTNIHKPHTANTHTHHTSDI